MFNLDENFDFPPNQASGFFPYPPGDAISYLINASIIWKIIQKKAVLAFSRFDRTFQDIGFTTLVNDLNIYRSKNLLIYKIKISRHSVASRQFTSENRIRDFNNIDIRFSKTLMYIQSISQTCYRNRPPEKT